MMWAFRLLAVYLAASTDAGAAPEHERRNAGGILLTAANVKSAVQASASVVPVTQRGPSRQAGSSAQAPAASPSVD